MLNEFLRSVSFLENTVKFQRKECISYRTVFSALTLCLFLLFTVFVLSEDYVKSAAESILYMSHPEKRNPGLNKLQKQFFNYSVMSNTNLELYNCKLMMTSKSIWEKSDADNTFLQSKVNDKKGQYKYSIMNAHGDSRIYFDLSEFKYGNELVFESVVYTHCENPEDIKKIEQSQFKVSLVSSTTLTTNLFSKSEPFNVVKDGNGETFDMNNNIQCMKGYLNSFDLAFKPIVIVNDDDYFRISSYNIDYLKMSESFSNESFDSDIIYLGKSKTMISEKSSKYEELIKQERIDYYNSYDVDNKDQYIKVKETENRKIIGIVNYLIDLRGDIIIRKYPKFKNLFPALLCIFWFIVMILKIIFSLYDHNLIYLEYINSFYTFTLSNSFIEGENGKEDNESISKSSFKQCSENPNSRMVEMESEVIGDNYKQTKNPLLEASFMKYPINDTLYYGNMKGEESKVCHATSNSNKVNNIASPDKADTFRISSSNMFKNDHKSKSVSEFQFTTCDMLRFILCKCFVKTKIKKSLFKNCKNQLLYYLDPLFYFRMCAANETSVCLGRASLEYSAIISSDYKHFQVLRKSNNNYSANHGKFNPDLTGNDIRVSFVCRDN